MTAKPPSQGPQGPSQALSSTTGVDRWRLKLAGFAPSLRRRIVGGQAQDWPRPGVRTGDDSRWQLSTGRRRNVLSTPPVISDSAGRRVSKIFPDPCRASPGRSASIGCGAKVTRLSLCLGLTFFTIPQPSPQDPCALGGYMWPLGEQPCWRRRCPDSCV